MVAKFRKDSLDCIANEDIATAQALGALIASITSANTITLGGEQITSVEFVVEFTWVSKGIVKMTSNWEGNHYMRLNSPYYYIAPDYCSAAGKHAYFYLDKDYNAGNDLVPAGIQPVEDAYGWYWDPYYVDAGYLAFMNQANTYMISVLWYEAASNGLYPNPTNEMWQWNIDHYNAAKADPNWKYE